MVEKITALYARFSRDDGQVTESASITHQRQLLQEYADHNGYTNCRFYVDDGYTGTNFDRPDFQRMLEDIENNLIETIIVKDMSRFGRNYILVGQYVELILPQYDVRVIGISDNYDSYDTENDMFAFSSIFNEMYAADISKKVRTAFRNIGMSGIKTKTRPYYGYKAKNNVYYDWEIDEEAATVVRMIYDMFLNQNFSINRIGRYLRENKYLIPYIYHGYNVETKNPYNWNFGMIKSILSNQAYCGDTINFKTRKISYKVKGVIHLPKEDWLIIPDQHPAIIDRKTFELVQEKLKTISDNSFCKSNQMINNTVFRKKCYCAMCNNLMYKGKRSFGVYYKCRYHMFMKSCEANFIAESELCRITSDHLKKLYHEIKNNKKSIIEKVGMKEIQKAADEITATENRLQELNSLLQTLYERFFRKEMSVEEYKEKSEIYISEKNNLIHLSETVKRAYSAKIKRMDEIEQMIQIFENSSESDFDFITEELSRKLIEKIIIGRPAGQKRKNYGKRIIDIYLYHLGNISDLVNVRYKKYSDRIKEIAPQLLKEGRCFQPVVSEILESGRGTIKNALAEEGTNFQTVIMEVKKEIIIDSIRKGLPVTQIYKLVGYSERSAVYWFIKRFLNTTYEELCQNIDKY